MSAVLIHLLLGWFVPPLVAEDDIDLPLRESVLSSLWHSTPWALVRQVGRVQHGFRGLVANGTQHQHLLHFPRGCVCSPQGVGVPHARWWRGVSSWGVVGVALVPCVPVRPPSWWVTPEAFCMGMRAGLVPPRTFVASYLSGVVAGYKFRNGVCGCLLVVFLARVAPCSLPHVHW